jgi:hypothetical protein
MRNVYAWLAFVFILFFSDKAITFARDGHSWEAIMMITWVAILAFMLGREFPRDRGGLEE